MSRSAGTGSPVWFHCWAARRAGGGWGEHLLKLTGRKKPYRTSRYSALGTRSTLTLREYECSCGHVGWSNHVDLLQLELGRYPTTLERMERP